MKSFPRWRNLSAGGRGEEPRRSRQSISHSWCAILSQTARTLIKRGSFNISLVRPFPILIFRISRRNLPVWQSIPHAEHDCSKNQRQREPSRPSHDGILIYKKKGRRGAEGVGSTIFFIIDKGRFRYNNGRFPGKGLQPDCDSVSPASSTQQLDLNPRPDYITGRTPRLSDQEERNSGFSIQTYVERVDARIE